MSRCYFFEFMQSSHQIWKEEEICTQNQNVLIANLIYLKSQRQRCSTSQTMNFTMQERNNHIKAREPVPVDEVTGGPSKRPSEISTGSRLRALGFVSMERQV